jgi:hypothetical protein
MRVLCRLGFHRFAGWGETPYRIGGPLPWARCARCGRVL